MVWTLYLPKKSLVVVVGGGIPNLVYSPGPGLWSLVLGPSGPDLGTDLNLTWDLDLDLSLTIKQSDWLKCSRGSCGLLLFYFKSKDVDRK